MTSHQSLKKAALVTLLYLTFALTNITTTNAGRVRSPNAKLRGTTGGELEGGRLSHDLGTNLPSDSLESSSLLEENQSRRDLGYTKPSSLNIGQFELLETQNGYGGLCVDGSNNPFPFLKFYDSPPQGVTSIDNCAFKCLSYTDSVDSLVGIDYNGYCSCLYKDIASIPSNAIYDNDLISTSSDTDGTTYGTWPIVNSYHETTCYKWRHWKSDPTQRTFQYKGQGHGIDRDGYRFNAMYFQYDANNLFDEHTCNSKCEAVNDLSIELRDGLRGSEWNFTTCACLYADDVLEKLEADGFNTPQGMSSYDTSFANGTNSGLKTTAMCFKNTYFNNIGSACTTDAECGDASVCNGSTCQWRTDSPTNVPSPTPTHVPSPSPTNIASEPPTAIPTNAPTAPRPTASPTMSPQPTVAVPDHLVFLGDGYCLDSKGNYHSEIYIDRGYSEEVQTKEDCVAACMDQYYTPWFRGVDISGAYCICLYEDPNGVTGRLPQYCAMEENDCTISTYTGTGSITGVEYTSYEGCYKNDFNGDSDLSASDHSFSFVGLGSCTDRYGMMFSQVYLLKKYSGLVYQKFDNVTECEDLCLSLPNTNELVGLQFDNIEYYENIANTTAGGNSEHTCKCLFESKQTFPSREQINAAIDTEKYFINRYWSRSPYGEQYTQYGVKEVDKACFMNTLKIPGESCEDHSECNKNLSCAGLDGMKVCTEFTPVPTSSPSNVQSSSPSTVPSMPLTELPTAIPTNAPTTPQPTTSPTTSPQPTVDVPDHIVFLGDGYCLDSNGEYHSEIHVDRGYSEEVQTKEDCVAACTGQYYTPWFRGVSIYSDTCYCLYENPGDEQERLPQYCAMEENECSTDTFDGTGSVAQFEHHGFDGCYMNNNNGNIEATASDQSFSFVGFGACVDRYGEMFSEIYLRKVYDEENSYVPFDNVTECEDLCLSLPNTNELVGLEFDNVKAYEALTNETIDTKTSTSQKFCYCQYESKASLPSTEEINAAIDTDTYVLHYRRTRSPPYTQYAVNEVIEACYANTLKIPGESCEDESECNKDLLCIGEEGAKVCTIATSEPSSFPAEVPTSSPSMITI